jgi:radical SAM superfamily enzyme YgiQ (UPF0313 family)
MSFRQAIIINPPHPSGYVSNKDSMGGFGQLYPPGAPPFPPIDIPYLAAFLVHRGFQVEVVESGALDLTTEELCEAVARVGAGRESLALVRTSLPTIDWDLRVCGDLRRRVELGGLALFGPVLGSLLQHIERATAPIDYMLIGEPDRPAAELMAGVPLPEIAGLRYRAPEGFRSNPERPFEADLDSLPFPRWELLPHERYVIPKSSTSGRMRFLPMLTSRGCPYGCSYCPYPVGQGLKWRYRSAGNVAEEMERLVRDFGVEHIVFRDPMFSLKQDRVVALCDEIAKRGIEVSWRCETRVDCLDEATIRAMAKAGCTGINFGVESTDPDIQAGVHRKPITTDEFIHKVELCRRHDIKTFAFFIVGLPGDTLETILNTIAFAVRIRPTWTQFTVATPFIGTGLRDWAVGRGLVSEESYQIVSSHVGSIGNENLTAEQVRRLHRFARFLGTNLINRRGVLKDATREDLLYRTAARAADRIFEAAATAFVRVGQRYFRRTIGAAGSGSVAPAPS